MSPAFLKKTPTISSPSAPSAEAIQAFKNFVDAETFQETLREHAKLLNLIDLKPDRHSAFYPAFKQSLKEHVPFKYKEIFKILTTKAKQKPYLGYPAGEQSVLVVGAGPCGLRAAIEAQLLGAKVVVIEKREEFTRHNILKLWKFLIQDFKALAVKKFVGNNHIRSITMPWISLDFRTGTATEARRMMGGGGRGVEGGGRGGGKVFVKKKFSKKVFCKKSF